VNIRILIGKALARTAPINAATIATTSSTATTSTYRCRACLVAYFMSLLCLPSFAQPTPNSAMTPARILVKFKTPDTRALNTKPATTKTARESRAALHRKLGVAPNQHRSFTHLPQLEVVDVVAPLRVKDVLERYRSQTDVAYAEPDYPLHKTISPNDPKLNWQSHLQNRNSIHAQDAWSVTTGNRSHIIAVIDTGVDYNHEDLIDNLWHNPDEIADGIDNDGNGYIDDIYGINAITRTGDPMDDDGHGTHVTGIIAATGNNGLGVSGVNWQSNIISCRFLSAEGDGFSSDAITCLNYLYDLKMKRNINIIASNNSWGGDDNSQALGEAIALQADAGILFIAAAGNESSKDPGFPSSYGLPIIISVAAHTQNDEKASFSNTNRRFVHLAAPGKDIYSTLPNNDYGFNSGTSMAAPVVTGIVGLMKSQSPELDWRILRARLLVSGRPSPSASLSLNTFTGKHMQAYGDNGQGALNCANQTLVRRISPTEQQVMLAAGSPLKLEVASLTCSGPGPTPSVTLSNGSAAPLLKDDGKGADKYANDGIFSATVNYEGMPFSIDVGGDTVQLETLTDDYCSSNNVKQITLSECNALVNFYINTQGSKWLDQDNWLSTNTPCDWFGVSCDDSFEPRHVESLDLKNNNVTGPLDSGLHALTSLSNLNLSDNHLSGAIPASWGALTEMQFLNLPNNNLSGELPSELGQMQQLVTFQVLQNQLSGSIPASFSQLQQLQYFYVNSNNFSGDLSPLAALTHLVHIDAQINQFTGGISDILAHNLQLVRISLSGNYLSGALPNTINQLQDLDNIDITGNQFSGTIPSELGELPKLRYAHLGWNKFIGTLPASLGQLSKLEILKFEGNAELQGPLPEALGLLEALFYLDFNSTRLCLPAAAPLLAKLEKQLGTLNGLRRCNANKTPVISLSAALSSPGGAPVNITASATDAEGDKLTSSWIQLSGPSVELINANSFTLNFVAPEVSSDVTLGFELSVSDDIGISRQALPVTIKAPPKFSSSLASSSSSSQISVSTPTQTQSSARAAIPPPSSGGGGSSNLWLLVLCSLMLCLSSARHAHKQ